MGADRHERARHGLASAPGKRRKYQGPPKDAQWIWFTREMIESKAFRSLSGNGLKILLRISIEHMAHGGVCNGDLVVTHDQFANFGVRRASVADAIREVEFLGFISVDRGIAYKGGHEPNVYRLTWIGDLRDAPPTNEWKGIGDVQISIWQSRLKDQRATKRKNTERKRQRRTSNVVSLHA